MMRLPQRASSHYFATSMSEKAPKFSPFSGEGEQKGNVHKDQQVSEVCSTLANHPEAALRESIVR